MRKSCLVLTLLVCCVLALGTSGCFDDDGSSSTGVTTTADPAALTTTTAQSTTTTTLAPVTWTSLTPTGDLPAARLGGSMVSVADGRKLLLFGGWAGGTSYINSIWSYDLATNTWTDLTTTLTKQGVVVPTGALPAARATQAMVCDPSTGKAIVFGGFDGTSYYNDTWGFELATNTWANLNPAGSVPAARGGHSMVYDVDSGKMILFGGWNGSTQFNDTWAYDPAANTWANLKPAGRVPTARDSQAMAYDPQEKVVLLFGGWSTLTEFSDTWAYDPATNSWANLEPTGTVPSGRALQQMVYDPNIDQMVVFGGGTTTVVHDDTWAYDPTTNTWNQANVSGSPPSARTGYAMLFNSTTRKVYLFGGSDGVTYLNDLWSLSP